jgi:hypothetical protein
MADDRLTHGFGLVFGRTILLKEGEGLKAALKFEGEAGGRHVFFGCADVVEKACKGESRGGKGGVLGELLFENDGCLKIWCQFDSFLVKWVKGGLHQ